MDEVARLGALMLVHAEDAAADRRRAWRPARSYAGFLASRRPPPSRAAIDQVIAQARRTGRAHPPAPPEQRRGPPRPARRAGRRGRPDGRDLPALPGVRGRGGARRGTEFKCCPPIRDAGNRERAVGRARRRRHRPGGLRPLAEHDRAQVGARRRCGRRLRRWPGAASPRSRCPCPRSGPPPAPAGSASPTSCGGWRSLRPTGWG